MEKYLVIWATVWLCCLQSALALRLPFLKRADPPPSPSTINLPLFFGSGGRYAMDVTMGPTSSPQRFNFTISTASGLAYVAGNGCSSCSDIPLYNQAASSTAQSINGTAATNFFSGATNGTLIKEQCGIATSNGSPWNYPNQTVVVVDQQNSNLLGNQISGIVGLGTNTGAGTISGSSSSEGVGISDSIPGQWFQRNPAQQDFTFGMMLQSPSGGSPGSDAGTLHWLKPDSKYYKPDQVSWATTSGASNGSSAGSAGQDWTVNLSGWSAVVGTNRLSSTNTVSAFVEPLHPNIYLPATEARLIHSAIEGAQVSQQYSTLGSASQAWTVPCESQYTFGLTVGSQTFILNPKDLIINQGGGTCVSAIEAFTDTTQSNYIVGARFISTVYLIFNVPRNGDPSLGFSPRETPKSKSNVGPIVGGTIGGVAILIIIGLAAWYYLSKRLIRNRGPVEIDGPEKPVQHIAIEPYTVGAPNGAFGSTATQVPNNVSVPSSPQVQPLLAQEDSQDVVAPPSYEEASSSSGRTPPAASTGFPRDVKGARASAGRYAHSRLSQSTAEPSTIAPSSSGYD